MLHDTVFRGWIIQVPSAYAHEPAQHADLNGLMVFDGVTRALMTIVLMLRSGRDVRSS